LLRQTGIAENPLRFGCGRGIHSSLGRLRYGLTEKRLDQRFREVLVNGKLVSVEQLSSGDSLLVSNASTLSTGSDGSAVSVVGQDAFWLRKNSKVVLNPAIEKT